MTSLSSTNPGGSVALGNNLIGKAAGIDLGTGKNQTDEVALAFADAIVAGASGSPGSSAWRKNLAQSMAYTIAHDAGHTFGLFHTLTPDKNGDMQRLMPNELLLTHGTLMRGTQEADIADPIIPRFKLTLDDLTTRNEWEQLATDPDIGLRDDNRNGIP